MSQGGLKCGGEDINEKWIDKAWAVYDKVLSVDFIRSQTLALAEAKNRRSVWNEISKIFMCTEKCKTPSKVSFAISSVTHHVLSGLTSIDQYAKRDMEGRGRHDLGHYQLLNEKHDLRIYMGTELAKELKLSSDCCTFLHEWCNSTHEFYYKKFGGPKVTDKADKTWIGQFMPSEQRYITWMEELTHKTKHDGNLKARILAMKTAREIIESAGFKEELVGAIEKIRAGEMTVEGDNVKADLDANT